MHLLAAADRRWRTVTGTIWSRGDENVLDVGREAYHQERAESHRPQPEDSPPTDGDDEEDGLGRWEIVHRFGAARPPFRLHLELVRQSGPPQEPSLPELLILQTCRCWVVSGGHGEIIRTAPDYVVHFGTAGDRWWVYEDGVERATTSSFHRHNIQNVPLLLRPARLLRAFDFASAAETDEAGRTAIRLSATPVAGQDAVRYAPELITLGQASYSITFDAATGIVLAWVATLDGTPAKGQSLSDVEIDGHVDEQKFSVPD